MQSSSSAIPSVRSLPERLNQECFCITLDRHALTKALEHEVGDEALCASLIKARPHLFSNAPVFISERETGEMLRVVHGRSRPRRELPGYRDAALVLGSRRSRRHDFGPRGAFMGYDFHLAATGPKLIEVNTNAGGAFLNALLAKAQRACCAEVEVASRQAARPTISKPASCACSRHEWLLPAQDRRAADASRSSMIGRPSNISIRSFVLAQRLFQKHGIEAVIADASELRYERGRLLVEGEPIDLVYNRLVDFSFDRPEHAGPARAYVDGAVVVTPNPHVHALLRRQAQSDPAVRSGGA